MAVLVQHEPHRGAVCRRGGTVADEPLEHEGIGWPIVYHVAARLDVLRVGVGAAAGATIKRGLAANPLPSRRQRSAPRLRPYGRPPQSPRFEFMTRVAPHGVNTLRILHVAHDGTRPHFNTHRVPPLRGCPGVSRLTTHRSRPSRSSSVTTFLYGWGAGASNTPPASLAAAATPRASPAPPHAP